MKQKKRLIKKSIIKPDIKLKNHLPIVDSVYSYEASAINNLIESKDVTSIGVIGGLGSGKSSIIKTLFSQYKKRYVRTKTIKISLGKFNTDKTLIKRRTRDNDIEKSILQQLLFRTRSTTLYASTIKRVPNTHIRFKFIYFMTALLSILSSVIYFGDTYWNTYELINQYESIIKMYSSIIFFVSSFLFLVKLLIDLLNGVLVKNIKYKDFEFIINESKGASPVDLFANELIYFFSRTKYELVVFEDLDRFDNIHNVLRSLRELNHLLNQNASINRKIIFIYAISDQTIDTPENKTKFFDGIVTVFPFMNNVSILDHLESIGVKKEQLKYDLSPYLMNKRLLNAIENDYKYFLAKFQDSNIDDDDLFVVAVYKNLVYEDFYDFLMGKGLVSYVIKNRQKFINSKINENKELISSKRKSITDIKNEVLVNKKELLTLIEKVIQTQVNTGYIAAKIRDDFFDLEAVNPNFSFTYYPNNSATLNYSKIPNLDLYKKRLENINSKNQSKIADYENDITELIKENNDISRTSLSNMISSYGIDLLTSDLHLINNKKQTNKLIDSQIDFLLMTLTKGYISEKQQIAISSKFTNYMSESDLKYIRYINIHKKPDFSYQIDNPNKVIINLDAFSFSLPYTLNFDLFDYLVINYHQHNEIWNVYTNQFELIHGEVLSFIFSYKLKERLGSELIKVILNKSTKFIDVLEANTTDVELYLKYIIKSVPIDCILEQNQDILRSLLSNIEDYNDFSSELEVEKFVKLMKLLDVKLVKVTSNSTELYENIINQNLFKMNIANVNKYIEYITARSYEDVAENGYGIMMNYSSYINRFVEYLKGHGNSFYSDIVFKYKNPSIDETEYINTLNNNEIDINIKKDYVIKVSSVINDVSRINDKNLWDDAVNYSRINYTVLNIFELFLNDLVVKKSITDFVNRNTHLEIEFTNDDRNKIIKNSKYIEFIYESINKKWLSFSNIEFIVDEEIIIEYTKITEESFLLYYIDKSQSAFNVKYANYFYKNQLKDAYIKYISKFESEVEKVIPTLDVKNLGEILLTSTLISDDFKTKLIQTTWTKLETDNDKNAVNYYVAKKWNHKNKVPFEILERIAVKSLLEMTILLEKQRGYGHIANIDIDRIFLTIGEPFSSLANGNEVLIPNNDINKRLLALLSNMKYTSKKYSVGYNSYRVKKT